MGKNTKKLSKDELITMRNPEAAENQLISMAMKLAAKKLKDGTASSQLITHFLSLATEKKNLENEKLKADLKLSEAKVKHLESQRSSSEMFEKAIKAFREYSGNKEKEEFDEDE